MSICSSETDASQQTNNIFLKESLSSTVGFSEEHIYLSQASESIALIRLSLSNPDWQHKVMNTLGNVLRLLNAVECQPDTVTTSSKIHKDDEECFDLRLRTTIIRAVGALCVLGIQADCIRIGGKVSVMSRSNLNQTKNNRSFEKSRDNIITLSTAAIAKTIEWNLRSAKARVVLNQQMNIQIQDIKCSL